MYPFMNDLNEVAEALLANANADWTENDPSVEFQAMHQMLLDTIQKINSQEPIERLSHYVSEDAKEAFDKLMACEDGETQADDIVDMWEPLMFRYTVSELLDQIGL